MSRSAWHAFPRTLLVVAFLALSAVARVQTAVDLHPAAASSAPVAAASTRAASPSPPAGG
jgi:hypothetical protein